ncbi:hypothetical protein NL676_023020 [Syzygium grande]|nr:hypothetical protein NL676_023020 [Syzygium grande]
MKFEGLADPPCACAPPPHKAFSSGDGSDRVGCHNAKTLTCSVSVRRRHPFISLEGSTDGATPTPRAVISSGSQLPGGHELDGGQLSPPPPAPPPSTLGVTAVGQTKIYLVMQRALLQDRPPRPPDRARCSVLIPAARLCPLLLPPELPRRWSAVAATTAPRPTPGPAAPSSSPSLPISCHSTDHNLV